MKGDIGMGWSSKKEGNNEWLLSKATQNYMTPSLYLCLLLAYDSPYTFNYKGKGLGMRLMSLQQRYRDGVM